MRIRRAYYDLFSHVYDRVIALHSGDANAAARDFLVERARASKQAAGSSISAQALGRWHCVLNRLLVLVGS